MWLSVKKLNEILIGCEMSNLFFVVLLFKFFLYVVEYEFGKSTKVFIFFNFVWIKSDVFFVIKVLNVFFFVFLSFVLFRIVVGFFFDFELYVDIVFEYIMISVRKILYFMNFF